MKKICILASLIALTVACTAKKNEIKSPVSAPDKVQGLKEQEKTKLEILMPELREKHWDTARVVLAGDGKTLQLKLSQEIQKPNVEKVKSLTQIFSTEIETDLIRMGWDLQGSASGKNSSCQPAVRVSLKTTEESFVICQEDTKNLATVRVLLKRLNDL